MTGGAVAARPVEECSIFCVSADWSMFPAGSHALFTAPPSRRAERGYTIGIEGVSG